MYGLCEVYHGGVKDSIVIGEHSGIATGNIEANAPATGEKGHVEVT